MLDAAIDDVLHVRASRIGEQGPVAQGSRARFKAALIPTYDLAAGEILRATANEIGRVQPAIGETRSFERRADRFGRVAKTERGVVEREVAGFALKHVPMP